MGGVRLLTALGGDVTVTNPLSDRTKGEVCELARTAGLTAKTLYTTVSCSHPPRTRNSRLPYHCGYCYPCLIRRSGLWHTLGADRSGYQYDHWLLPTRDTKSADLAGLLLWLSTPLTTTDLIAGLPLPSEISPSDLMPVQHRARRELSAMLTSMLPEEEPHHRLAALPVNDAKFRD